MREDNATVLRKQTGYSLVELLIYVALMGILGTLVFGSFIQVMRPAIHETGIVETKLETSIGMDLLRMDLEHAGFGLPWDFNSVVPNPYNEPAPLAVSPSVPGAISSADLSVNSMNTSDYLVIRAMNVLQGATSQKWGWVGRSAASAVSLQTLTTTNFDVNDRVIVIRPVFGPGPTDQRQLIMDAANSYESRGNTVNLDPDYAPPAGPNDPNGERYLVYGVDNTGLRAPFNRTDYFINAPNANGVAGSAHCAPGTGTLVKTTMNHNGPPDFTYLPMMDCVADFQVVYFLDTDTDGGWDTQVNANGLAALTAQQIRDQVKSIRCFVLAHEGGLDTAYTHPAATITVGVSAAIGRQFDVSTLAGIGATWPNYRWKVYSLAVTPRNLK